MTLERGGPAPLWLGSVDERRSEQFQNTRASPKTPKRRQAAALQGSAFRAGLRRGLVDRGQFGLGLQNQLPGSVCEDFCFVSRLFRRGQYGRLAAERGLNLFGGPSVSMSLYSGVFGQVNLSPFGRTMKWQGLESGSFHSAVRRTSGDGAGSLGGSAR
jgi:hypothetical protein